MFHRFWNHATVWFVAVVLFLQPVFAFAAEEEKEPPEWVLSYFLVLLCLSLAVIILLRTANRSETAYTQDELDAIKAEKTKKMAGGHGGH